MRRRRGVTLVELCVVMALIAILSTMVVSFCVLIHRFAAIIDAERDASQSLSLVDMTLRDWLREFDSEEYTILISDSNKELVAESKSGSRYTLKKLTDSIEGELTGGRLIENELYEVSDISFTRKFGRDDLLSCWISYTRRNPGGKPASYTQEFIVYLHCATIEVES